jgi:hypothetical protein
MMKNDTTYNGWTNKQTWNINLMYGELFTSMCKDQTFDDVEHLADAFESMVDELEFQTVKENTLAHNAVGEYLDRVDWNEIAEHYAADFDLFQEEVEADLQELREVMAELE